MSLTADQLAARADALRRARVDSQIEGLSAEPNDAAALDAWARGEIDRDEAFRRFDENLRARLAAKAQQAA